MPPSITRAPRIDPRVRWQIWTLFGTVLLVMIGFGIVLPILPFLARRFGASSVEMGLLITGWALAQFLASPAWGVLADRIGRKPVLMVGLAGYGVMFVAMALAPSYGVLLVARVLGGLLSSSVLPSAQAIAADLTKPEDRGGVMGILGAAFGVGFMVGPALGGTLATLGPQVPFYFAAVAAALSLPVVLRWVREPPADGRRLRTARPGIGNVSRALASSERPLYLMAFAATFGGSSLFSMLGYYAMDRAGASPSQVGAMFTAFGLGSVVTQAGLVGPISRRWGEGRGIMLGFGFGALGFLSVSAAGSVPTMTLAVGLTSVAMALIRPSLAALNSRLTTTGFGTSLGLQSAFDSLGRSLGPLWAGGIYELAPLAPFAAAAGVYAIAAAAAPGLPRPAEVPSLPPPVIEPADPPAV